VASQGPNRGTSKGREMKKQVEIINVIRMLASHELDTKVSWKLRTIMFDEIRIPVWRQVRTQVRKQIKNYIEEKANEEASKVTS
jgi:hypothetical protein